MKIKIGKFMILWGDPMKVLSKEFEAKFDARTKYNALMKNLKEVLRKIEEEENEPPYIKEVKGWLHDGNVLMAVKVYWKATGMGLKEAKDDVVRMKEKMEVDAKK